jgi:hypothetical protein
MAIGLIQRRQFIAALRGAAAWPIAAGAQQPPTPVVGLLDSIAPDPLRLSNSLALQHRDDERRSQ